MPPHDRLLLSVTRVLVHTNCKGSTKLATKPSMNPSTKPSLDPSFDPSSATSSNPSSKPSLQLSLQPSLHPSTATSTLAFEVPYHHYKSNQQCQNKNWLVDLLNFYFVYHLNHKPQIQIILQVTFMIWTWHNNIYFIYNQ